MNSFIKTHYLLDNVRGRYYKQIMKSCSICKKLKPKTEFYRYKVPGGSDIVRSACKICLKVAQKQALLDPIKRQHKRDRHRCWCKNHSEYLREIRLKKRFGLSVQDYEHLFTGQNGCCAICGNPETLISAGGLQRLAVDHDHRTNKVRGLLCYRCNSALGLFQDSESILEQALLYLKSGR